MRQPVKSMFSASGEDTFDEKNVQDNAGDDDQDADDICARTLLLDFSVSRAVISFSARSAYASQRHQLIPPFIQFPLAVSRL